MLGVVRNAFALIFSLVTFGLTRLRDPYHLFPISCPSVASVRAEYLTMYSAILRYCPSE